MVMVLTIFNGILVGMTATIILGIPNKR
jgi:hypothetical protein